MVRNNIITDLSFLTSCFVFIDVVGNDTVTTGEKNSLCVSMQHIQCIIVIIDIPVVTTPEPRCNDFDLRLANISFSSQDGSQLLVSGTVETCNDGSYFSICDVGWDDIEAQLICNALGYVEPYFRMSSTCNHICGGFV